MDLELAMETGYQERLMAEVPPTIAHELLVQEGVEEIQEVLLRVEEVPELRQG